MSKSKTAKLFRNGRSQALRLPREFRFEGDEVRIRKVGDGVLLEPVIPDPEKWFAALGGIWSPSLNCLTVTAEPRERVTEREVYFVKPIRCFGFGDGLASCRTSSMIEAI